ncbi:MAG TPA: trypsin-like peptidase domain-containing protein [Thermoanaerobaculia bacterium]|jgi:serine protease Do|nr:trypsin-like peptidase domain-containing protein [Thermoanaerobaculia bacterium]
MTARRGRWWATGLLVVGAVAFGMVLAGSVQWTPAGWTSPAEDAGAVSVHAGGGLPGFADLAEAVAPAVVTIRAVSFQEAPEGQAQKGAEGGPAQGDPFFDFFFGPRRRDQPSPERQPQAPQEFRSEAGGSGFVITADGLIATNYHVIEGASELMVTVGDDPRELPAKVRGTDPATDLALIQIATEHRLPHLKLGDSARVRVGDWIMVIGNPLRLGRTVTVGVVSAVGRSGLGITDVSFENFLQTDAAINFGNSGGPMVNLDGEVVGIATAINWGAENVGFAVPASTLAKVMPQLEKQGKVRRGYLGVNIENLDFRAQQAFGLPPGQGALVIQVNEDTPGASAGLQHGDVILSVDGHKVGTTRDLIDYVSDHPPGAQVQLEVLRDGKRESRTVTLGERPVAEETPEPHEDHAQPGIDWLGLRYSDLTPGIRSSHGIPDALQGIWLRGVSPRSPLVDENVEPGDVITEVNGQQVKNVAEFESVVKAARAGAYLRFYVQRFDPRSGRSGQFFAFARVP